MAWDNTLFLRNDETVWATGDNNYGQLGVGDNTTRYSPIQVILPDGTPLTNVAQVIMDDDSTIFLRNDGTVWATGYNDFGQLGVGDYTNRYNPTQVILPDGAPLTDVAQVIQIGMIWHLISSKRWDCMGHGLYCFWPTGCGG